MFKAVLTIDDMPQGNTRAIIDYLCEKGIKVVFFTVGNQAENDLDTVVYAIQKGMVIGNHTYSHPDMAELSYDEAIAEIEKTEKIINEAYEKAGVERPVKLFRFPYLSVAGEDVLKYLKDNGFKRVDDSDVKEEDYFANGWGKGCFVSCSYDCQEYLVRPHIPDFSFADVMNKIDRVFGNQEEKEDQTEIILLHTHDDTEAEEPEYYKTIIDRMISLGTQFVEPQFVEG